MRCHSKRAWVAVRLPLRRLSQGTCERLSSAAEDSDQRGSQPSIYADRIFLRCRQPRQFLVGYENRGMKGGSARHSLRAATAEQLTTTMLSKKWHALQRYETLTADWKAA